jgi:DNA-binding transcriptional ArsR family regulator
VLDGRLRKAFEFGKKADQVRLSDEARERWHAIYGGVSAEIPGLLGAVTSRAESHVIRLALIYSVLDQSQVISVEHLEAALEVWRYCFDSARHIFGDSLGDPDADTILDALRRKPEGLIRTDISDLFRRHRTPERINRALSVLERAGLARMVREKTGGRTAERWIAVSCEGSELSEQRPPA